MEIQPRRAVALSGANFFRWGLRGGALSALAPLIFYIGSFVGEMATAAIVLGAGVVVGGTIPTVIALLARRPRNTLAHIERELERARMMMERRLIDEDDYQRLKSQALEQYRLGSGQFTPIWPLAFWGAISGAAMLGFIFVLSSGAYMFGEVAAMTAGAALVGGSITGGAAQTYAALTGQGARAQLPAPQQGRRMLGE